MIQNMSQSWQTSSALSCYKTRIPDSLLARNGQLNGGFPSVSRSTLFSPPARFQVYIAFRLSLIPSLLFILRHKRISYHITPSILSNTNTSHFNYITTNPKNGKSHFMSAMCTPLTSRRLHQPLSTHAPSASLRLPRSRTRRCHTVP